MKREEEYFLVNKDLWNKKILFHKDSEFYDLKKFKEGKSSLNDIELNELGDIKGKSILHLQCHFGQDTLSLARLGADVTGVDFSDKAIELAESLNNELKQNARFICSDIYGLKEKLDEKFDIVFTSYGVIGWLPDLVKWAEIVNQYLKPGGIFFMVEFHPVLFMLDENICRIQYSYFNKGVIEEDVTGTYADKNADLKHKMYGWNHSLSDVFSSLLNCGLKIISFKEYDYSAYNCFNNLIEIEKNKWQVKGFENILPLMYSVKCIKID